jgi:hypothetical protein
MMRQQQIFVLDLADGPAFAFEAESAVAAEALVSTPWFAQALDDFCARGCKTWGRNSPVRARAASETEALLYLERVAEFAEESGQLLMAHIGEP